MKDETVKHFYEVNPTLENYWRAIILFGRNTASYKFALAKSLYELARSGSTGGTGTEAGGAVAGELGELVKMEDLAPVFARHITDHLGHSDRQGTSENSRFLDACRSFNRGEIGESDLVEQTLRLGFQNVIDAFPELRLQDEQ